VAPPPPPPPHPAEEVVEEILLRFSRASLVRATLLCKLWHRIASATAFHRRYLEFHRAAPMLGILCRGGQDESNDYDDVEFNRTAPMMGLLGEDYSENYDDDDEDEAEDDGLPTASSSPPPPSARPVPTTTATA
jgi:hypothetical protein